jgi:hypothetical protein
MGGEAQRHPNDIPRSLDQGWHYRPDWRNSVVEAYLVEKPLREPPWEALRGEDAFVRQFFFFRRCGGCLERPAFKWAYECHVNNAITGAASLVKALTVARVPVNEIAGKLRTTRKNIALFQRLYFDAIRYLDDQGWLASIIFAPLKNPNDPAEFRDRHLMTAAFLHGERGVGQVFCPTVTLTPEERDERLQEIRAALTTRASEFIMNLRIDLVPPAREDFEALIKLLDASARQPAPDSGDKNWAFSVAMLCSQAAKAAERPENHDNPVLQMVHKTLTEPEAEGPKKALSW